MSATTESAHGSLSISMISAEARPILTVPSGNSFERFIHIEVAVVFRAGQGKGHRAFSERLGKLLLRFLQRLFHPLALSDVHRHAKHLYGVTVACVVEFSPCCNPAHA